MMLHFHAGRQSKVLIPCNRDWLNEADIPDKNIITIEEDEQGEDVLTFMCPVCNHKHKSRRYGA